MIISIINRSSTYKLNKQIIPFGERRIASGIFFTAKTFLEDYMLLSLIINKRNFKIIKLPENSEDSQLETLIKRDVLYNYKFLSNQKSTFIDLIKK